MRDYGRVFSSFWQSEDARNFSEDGRMLALYLMTSPHANLIGCFRLPDAYASDDLQWPLERVSKGFKELQSKGFLRRDDGSKWVLICKYLAWNKFENGNVATAAQKAFDQVPSIPLKAMLAAALLDFGSHLKEPFLNHLETLRKPFIEPFVNPEPEPEPEPEPILNHNPATTLFGEAPAEPAPAKVKTVKVDKPAKEPPPSTEAWNAYAQAYRQRYQAEPVRNARVNGQMAQLVGRIGAEEAPQVAAWYIGHRNQRYVANGHSVGLLLMDCEKLRTEWATGRQVTQTQAIQSDKTQANFNVFDRMIQEAKAREAANGS